METIDSYKNLNKLTEKLILKDFRLTISPHPLFNRIHLKILKRMMDIIISLIIIIFLLSWIFPLLFILSRFFSEGPILFVQKRVGKNNNKFNCYKFRTIKPEEQEIEKFSPIFINDSRLTKIGRILRRSNLDELPQFINVLKGDMSIVGPRPHAIAYEKIYSGWIHEYSLRYSVKPGITGWAQIHGLRGDVLDENENKSRARKRVQYDLWYIKNRSFPIDVKIIFRTILLLIKQIHN